MYVGSSVHGPAILNARPQRYREPLVRVNELAETIRDADPLARRCSPAQRLTNEFLCLYFTPHRITNAPSPRSNPPVCDFDKPVTEQIRSRVETVRPESSECRVTSFEHGREGVHHGRIPVLCGVKKTTVFFTEFLSCCLLNIFRL